MTAKKFFEESYVVQDHLLIKNSTVIVLDKLTVREIYSVLLLASGYTPTSQKYFGKAFPSKNFD